MAKKRKDEPADEQLDFQIPKFDEESFIKRERRNIKTLFLSFLFGLLIALLCFGFWVAMGDHFLRWELVLLVAVVNSIWLKYLFLKLNIDLSDFGRKGWLTSFVTYFFTWLVVLIVLVNPPFYDAEPPLLDAVVLPGIQEPGGTVMIVAHIVDNVGVQKTGINFSFTDPNGMLHTPEFIYEDNIFRYTFKNQDNLLGVFNYSFIVADVNNMVATASGSFVYDTAALQIISSRNTSLMSGDAITIKADERISEQHFRVYYTLDNGSEINVNLRDINERDRFETNPEFEGWAQNSTMTMRVYAEVRYYFINNPERFSNTVQDTTVYSMSTAVDPNIGTRKTLVEWNYSAVTQLPNTLNYQLPHPIHMAATPGFEILAMLCSLVIVVLLFRQKKKKKQT